LAFFNATPVTLPSLDEVPLLPKQYTFNTTIRFASLNPLIKFRTMAVSSLRRSATIYLFSSSWEAQTRDP
jgi:hypothetical protein